MLIASNVDPMAVIFNDIVRHKFRYKYFEPGEGDKDISYIQLHIPLNLSNYGFPDSRRVKIDMEAKTKINLKPSMRQFYECMINTDEVPLNFVLETLTMVVNDSMEYDFEKALDGIKKYVDGYTSPKARMRAQKEYQGFLDGIKICDYKPFGDETMHGICTDSGDLIRELVKITIIDPELRYTKTRTNVHHDVTTVFDIETGNWVVLNSKSPLKLYYLVPKDIIPDLRISAVDLNYS